MDISIVSSGHDVADARLHREVAALQRAGLTVEVLGLGDSAAGPPGARVRAWRRGGNVRRAGRAVYLPWIANGTVLMALDPDTAAGAWLRRVAGRLLPGLRKVWTVADVHEDYRLLLRDRSWAHGLGRVAGAAWARLGEAGARRADLTVVADPSLLATAERRVVLRNLPDRLMLPEPAEREATPRALYVGDLRRSRGLFAMLEAVGGAAGWSLDLVGPIAPADRPEFERLMASPLLRGRVRWFDRLPPREAWLHARGAWVGLLLLEDTPAFQRALPSKLHEYLACGLPVVATPLPRVAEVLTSTGAGVLVADAAEAATALSRWVDGCAELDVLREAALSASADLPDEAGPFALRCRELVEVGHRRADRRIEPGARV